MLDILNLAPSGRSLKRFFDFGPILDHLNGGGLEEFCEVHAINRAILLRYFQRKIF